MVVTGMRPISPKEALRVATPKESAALQKSLTEPLENNDLYATEERVHLGVRLGVLSDDPFGNIALAGLHEPEAPEAIAALIRYELAREGTAQKERWSRGSRGDVVYVYNFRNPRQPRALTLTRGSARSFKEKVESLYSTLKRELSLVSKSDAVLAAVEKTIESIFGKIAIFSGGYPQESPVAKFFAELQAYSLEHYAQFTDEAEKKDHADERPWKDPKLPWRVNVFVDGSDEGTLPPIIFADASLHHLVGWIEYSPLAGGNIHTNHLKIISGALPKANGGFLIVSADELVRSALAWHVLKQIVRSREFSFRPLINLGLLPPQMDPLGIDLRLRVVLYGTRDAFDTIRTYDPEFSGLFSAYAERSLHLERDDVGIRALGKLVRARMAKRSLLPLSRGGAGALIEYACRQAEQRSRFTSDAGAVARLYDEAHCKALVDGTDAVGRKHIEGALRERHLRSNVFEEDLKRAIREKIILVTAEGEAVGQINALAVRQSNGEPFGFPFRMTAVSSVGEFNVQNAHRSAGLSGNISEKADETVLGLFKSIFGQDFLLTADISISFEQTYGGIEGDSASLAEFYAILSSVAQIPMRQSLAITGSVNLHGEIQPIGCVNEKIEGFFDACLSLGKLAKQGVLIPHQNRDHLMLRRDIVYAIRNGTFAVYPLRTLAEGAEILMSRPYEEIVTAAKTRLLKFYCLANAEIEFAPADARNEPDE